MKAKVPSRDIKNEFERIFQTKLMMFFDTLFGFDIIKFDIYIQRKHQIRYEDGETSLKKFIFKKYGIKGIRIIKKLIKV